jgi:hypothetical protein
MNIAYPERLSPRTGPLVIDDIVPDRLPTTKAYIHRHGGTLYPLADGGYLLDFPDGTIQQCVQQIGDDGYRIHIIQFPDQAQLTWYQEGNISKGIPRNLRNSLGIVE